MNSLRLGGSQTYGLELARELDCNGFDITMVAKIGALASVAATSHSYHEVKWREGSAKTPRDIAKRVILIESEHVAARRLARTIAEPLAVIVSQPWPMHFFALRMRRKWPSTFLFGLVHGTSIAEFPPPDSKRVLPLFDHFFTTTSETQTMLNAASLRSTLLGNLFDGAGYWGTPPAMPTHDKPTRIVLSLGTLTPNKTAPVYALIEAALLRPDWRVQVVGDGPDRRRLEATTVALGLSARVSFLGGVTDPRPWILGADLVIAAGRAAMEAASAARPVIVASTEGIHGLLTQENLSIAAAANFTGRSQMSVPVSTAVLLGHAREADNVSQSDLVEIQRRLWHWGDVTPLLTRLNASPQADADRPHPATDA